jgi:hypothetical protein
MTDQPHRLLACPDLPKQLQCCLSNRLRLIGRLRQRELA